MRMWFCTQYSGNNMVLSLRTLHDALSDDLEEESLSATKQLRVGREGGLLSDQRLSAGAALCRVMEEGSFLEEKPRPRPNSMCLPSEGKM